jgi:hypothetical protein
MKVIYIKNTTNGTKEGAISGDLPLPTANSLIEKGLAVEYTENEIETELIIKKTKKEK